MSPLRLNGSTSGYSQLDAPAIAGDQTFTLPGTGGTLTTTSGGQTIQHATGTAAAPSVTFTGDVNTGIFNPAADTIAFAEGGVESARIDASGRLLVGTTTAATGTNAQYSLMQVVGNSAGGANFGIIDVSRNENSVDITLNEPIGLIIFGDKQGGEYAQIQASADGTAGLGDYPGRLAFHTTADGASSPTARMVLYSNGNPSIENATKFRPGTDNAISLGASGERWTAVWAANGTIQTSDERAKIDITAAQLGSDFIKSLRPVSYKWVEGGKVDSGKRDEDGNYIYESVPGTRTHWGFIAQEVKQVVDAVGVDFGGWVLTDKDDPDSQQALRYDQFIAPLTKALQEAMERIETLEAQNATFESRLAALEVN